MNARTLSLIAGAGSALMLVAALSFQAAGYAPCELCILQRWPHLAAVVIALLVWLTGRRRLLAPLGVIAALLACVFGVYHGGVEMGWWQGPTHCSGGLGNVATLSLQDLTARLNAAPVVRCDEVAWRFLTLSMAGWNAILSAGLTVVWGASALMARKD